MITPEIVVAYTQCKLKAYFLLCTDKKGKSHEYISILQNETSRNRSEYFNKVKTEMTGSEPYSPKGIKRGIPALLEVTLSFDDLEIYTDAIIKKRNFYSPVLVVGTQKINKEQRLQLGFIGYVLSKFQKKKAVSGTIVGKGNKKHTIKLETLYKEIRYILKNLKMWRQNSKPETPPVILNNNCPVCPFRDGCKAKAEERDDLSLLGSLTNKAVLKYQKKGIFTVNQLSYLFRPRKRRKRKKGTKTSIRFRPELQALAIRTKKIYIQELPELSKCEVELFMDIEGIPDQDFFYLIGLLVIIGNKLFFHSFWANSINDEQLIWNYFIDKVNEYPDAPIYHYGEYDSRAINKLANR